MKFQLRMLLGFLSREINMKRDEATSDITGLILVNGANVFGIFLKRLAMEVAPLSTLVAKRRCEKFATGGPRQRNLKE